MDLSKQSSRLWTLAWVGSSYRRCNGGHRDKRIVHSVSSHPQVHYFMSVTTSVARNTYNTSSSKDNSTSSLHREKRKQDGEIDGGG